MPSIIIEKGKEKGRTVQLKGEERIYFGRDNSCNVFFDDTLASRQHFCIEQSEKKYRLLDLGSRNGTFLNSDQVKKAITLNYGDHIIAGETVFSFLTEEEAKERGGLVGLTIGGYRIEEWLGRGGMGTVYRATQLSLQRPVALKILSPSLTTNQKHLDRFIREARAAGNLAHPSVVEVYDVGNDGDTHFISMEYLSGGSMEELLLHTDKILPIGAISLIQDVARGLQYAEEKNVVHRDIKPENLMVDREGTVKICDLGIAVGPEDGQSEGKVIGTPHYMAPEQAMGRKVDHRSDIYSLGCTFYRMLAGKLPFTGASHDQILEKQVFFQPPALHTFIDEVSTELSDLVEWMMAKEPDQRMPNATVLLQELDRCMAIESATGGNPVQPLHKPGPKKRNTKSRKKKTGNSRKKAGNWWLPLLAAGLILPPLYLFKSRNPEVISSPSVVTKTKLITVREPILEESASRESKRVSSWLRDAEAYSRLNPDDLEGAVQRYEMVLTHFPDAAQQKTAVRALRRLHQRKRQNQMTEEAWQATVKSAQESVDNLNFGSAIASINTFQRKYPDSGQSRSVGQHVEQVEQLAEETFKRFIDKAEGLRTENNTHEASAIYKNIIDQWGLDRFVQNAKDRLYELEQAQDAPASNR
ncbi:MAG: serine/threonine-protein kinase [Planctomycetota bacterium]|nr:serine/threonine-protein kinase [Planctomycetota bacterium]MDA1138135.1 serine/threonine-protein kinase [Planctomycetota bacterium]